VRALARELLPDAPKLGLYLAPDIPSDKLENALADFAKEVRIPDVIALYDGTLMGSAKDGVVFCEDRLVFQNSNLDQPQEIWYEDIVQVSTKKLLLRGEKVVLDVNRGRATTEVMIDFSAHDDAAKHVALFLGEAMLKGVDFGRGSDAPPERSVSVSREVPESPSTDRSAVEDMLGKLQRAGKLTREDKYRMLEALEN
jgi:hypothetical protein